MFSLLRRILKRNASIALQGEWAVNWYGPSDMVLTRGTHRYGIYFHERFRRGLKTVRTVHVGEMPEYWLRPHDRERLTDADKKEILRMAKLAVDGWLNELHLVGAAPEEELR